MFRWIKQHGCNCHPMPEGCEKYSLGIGGHCSPHASVFGGVVENEPKFGGSWSASVFVCGQKVTGKAGGGMTRDGGMKWVEEYILKYIAEIEAASKNKPGEREIYDSLWKRDEAGEFAQNRLD